MDNYPRHNASSKIPYDIQLYYLTKGRIREAGVPGPPVRNAKLIKKKEKESLG